MSTVKEALNFARLKHLGQMYGDLPYYQHIVQTVDVARTLKYSDDVQKACALHDILEDTPLSYNDLFLEFGMVVANIVYDVTDELGKNRKERKERTYPKIRASHDAILVKLCDRIANAENSSRLNKRMFDIYQKEHRYFLAGITKGVHFSDEIVRGMTWLNAIMNPMSDDEFEIAKNLL